MAVINMLNDIHSSGDDGSKFIQSAKEGKSSLMGFGHRVYRNYDPRAKILSLPVIVPLKHWVFPVLFSILLVDWKR